MAFVVSSSNISRYGPLLISKKDAVYFLDDFRGNDNLYKPEILSKRVSHAPCPPFLRKQVGKGTVFCLLENLLSRLSAAAGNLGD